MSKQTLSQIPGGPPAIGPYSPVVIAEGKFAFISGQIPFDPAVGAMVRGSITEQTEIVLSNLKRAVEATGATLADVVSCRVFLQPFSAETFGEMNAVYAAFSVKANLLDLQSEQVCLALMLRSRRWWFFRRIRAPSVFERLLQEHQHRGFFRT